MHSLANDIGDNEYKNSNSNHNKALPTLVTQSETSPVTIVRQKLTTSFLKIKNPIQRSPAINESPSIPFLFFFSFSFLFLFFFCPHSKCPGSGLLSTAYPHSRAAIRGIDWPVV
ncbi:hypothetical protein I7I53_11677 [Histoplasma capsulatum var. duboisii H88]|uniref:Uncharacterized protein n=1 Tax=Ajellomyces capsulatus (strain H88) TaxID=544711 RepID=A0A8A1LW91_AJEC8|nr:hypothetical protein I7I53_11677 [Histoplasma capsulatum var. duboisii H88]